MLRVILLIAAVAALVWLLRRAFAPKPDAREAPRADPKSAVDELVRCAHCGLHVPRNGAALRDGRHYCSDAHARLGAREDAP